MRGHGNKMKYAAIILAVLVFCLPAVSVKAEPAEGAVLRTAVVRPATPVMKGVAVKNSVTLTWNTVKNAFGYQIYLFYPGEQKFKCVSTLKAGVNSLTLVGSLDRTYTYKIRAYSRKNNKRIYSPMSQELVIKTAPSGAVISSMKRKTGNTLVLNWRKVPSADGYQIYRSEQKNGPYTRRTIIHGNETFSYTDTGLDKNKFYYYKVRACRKNPGTIAFGAYSVRKRTDPRPVMVIGDSRTVMMEAAVGNEDITWICKSSMGYEWFRDTAVKEAEAVLKNNTDVVIWLGVNDLYNNLGEYNNYVTLINELARRWKLMGVNVYFMEVGPLDSDPYATNEEIEEYNGNLKERLEGTGYISLYSWLKKTGYITIDGIHYDYDTSKKVYSYMMKNIL